MWLADGRWRQWESYSCVNVDSVHNDGERHIPYLMLWPDALPSKMRAWAAGAMPDGMIQEQLACGCEGRRCRTLGGRASGRVPRGSGRVGAAAWTASLRGSTRRAAA
mmetsp:Transcript_7283/g.20851  ORF Transcript_7283/g.20851 Transcript_7283/m.20851 type:complete len:107 (-) Transcript_7283:1004-1324(-)